MIKLIFLMTFQSSFLVLSQVLLKIGLGKIPSEGISFVRKVFLFSTNVWVIFSLFSLVMSAVIWLYVLKRYDFSVAYPLISISYILAAAVSYFVFKENVNGMMMLGITFIIAGVFIITQSKNI
jgi:undecaprenyl phosphate-alpha-L-ara4N flippase subunit ArnE